MNKPVEAVPEIALPAPEEREAAVYARLSTLGIAWTTHSHASVFTVTEARHLRGSLPGLHTKNLFLEDRKDEFWLVIAREELAVDLNALAKRIGAPRFSFGKTEDMIALLGIEPGAVNAFAVMNDRDLRVTLVLDEVLAAGGIVNFHPMRNDRTTAILAQDLVRFLEACGHAPMIVALPEKGRADQ
jgi:Ala-tRNA(Pro) deacylase